MRTRIIIANFETSMLKFLRFLVILFLLGLGVHFGFFAPRGTYTLAFAGIFGATYFRVVELTLLIYVAYRAALIVTKVRIAQSAVAKTNSTMQAYQDYHGALFRPGREVFLLGLLIIPILIGMAWAKQAIDISDLRFTISRIVGCLLIFLMISILYREDIEFKSTNV